MKLIDADKLADYICDECGDENCDRSPSAHCVERDFAVKSAKKMPTIIDAVSRYAYEQVAWERDIALAQLDEIGKSFGQKMDDVVPVVRCKDCKYRNNVANCERFGRERYVQANSFCSWGERKDDA